jgi:hypothetical protein
MRGALSKSSAGCRPRARAGPGQEPGQSPASGLPGAAPWAPGLRRELPSHSPTPHALGLHTQTCTCSSTWGLCYTSARAVLRDSPHITCVGTQHALLGSRGWSTMAGIDTTPPTHIRRRACVHPQPLCQSEAHGARPRAQAGGRHRWARGAHAHTQAHTRAGHRGVSRAIG